MQWEGGGLQAACLSEVPMPRLLGDWAIDPDLAGCGLSSLSLPISQRSAGMCLEMVLDNPAAAELLHPAMSKAGYLGRDVSKTIQFKRL